MSKWISVKERLAPPFEHVLVYDATRQEVREDVRGNGQWLNRITHWMPLPDPPKEEK